MTKLAPFKYFILQTLIKSPIQISDYFTKVLDIKSLSLLKLSDKLYSHKIGILVSHRPEITDEKKSYYLTHQS